MSNPTRGWFLMHRGWMASEDFQPEPFTEREAFLWSIEQCAHTPHLQWFNKHQVAVGRGEFVTSVRQMARVFRWGEKRVRGFTNRMVKCGKWTHRGTHPDTILTVCNYEQFQSPLKGGDTPEGRPGAHQGHTEDTQQKEGINNGKEWEAIKLEASPPSRAAAQPISEAFAMWTEAAASTQWPGRSAPLNDNRRKGLSSILKTHGLDGWRRALQRALDSPMLNGPDPPAWFNLDFICKPKNFDKLEAGNYDRSFPSKAAANGNVWLVAREQLGRGIPGAAGHREGAGPGEQLQLSSRRSDADARQG